MIKFYISRYVSLRDIRSTYPFDRSRIRLILDLLTDICEGEYIAFSVALGATKAIDMCVCKLRRSV